MLVQVWKGKNYVVVELKQLRQNLKSNAKHLKLNWRVSKICDEIFYVNISKGNGNWKKTLRGEREW